MSLESKIMTDLKAAMKTKNQASLRGIRAIKAALLLAKTDGSGTEISTKEEIKILQRLVKQRQDSLEIYKQQGRSDLAEIEQEEIQVIQNYLPKQMSQDELVKIIGEIINSTGASGMKDMGKVMGIASQKIGGQADGKTIASVVKGILSQ